MVVQQQLCRTRMCYVFQRCGVCRDNCSFAHSSRDLREWPDLKKPALCIEWKHGACRAVRCRYAHGTEELRATAGVFKTQLRHWYASGGNCNRCKWGARCRHAHGEDELRRPLADEAVKLCTGKTVYAI